jgi:hypothetical protein
VPPSPTTRAPTTVSDALLDKDGIHLRYAAAASLPRALIEATDGMAVGPDAGSCGSAAYSREPVFAPDVQLEAFDDLQKSEAQLRHLRGGSDAR